MFKNELKNELYKIFEGTKNIDSELVKIKVAIHNLEKLGLNTGELEKLLDAVGIEFYKFKTKNADLLDEHNK